MREKSSGQDQSAAGHGKSSHENNRFPTTFISGDLLMQRQSLMAFKKKKKYRPYDYLNSDAYDEVT